jgi:hypothetical protein
MFPVKEDTIISNENILSEIYKFGDKENDSGSSLR